MEARAVNRYVSSSPRKMRLVIDLIRGKSVDVALHLLHFSPKHASKVAEKVLRSAVSNLQNKDGGGRLEPEQMTVKSVCVDVSMTMKRSLPAPMGRAYKIRKRSHHLTIVVAAKEERPAATPRRTTAAKAESKPAARSVEESARTKKKSSSSPKKKTEAAEKK